jgi:hypothetical protein
MLTGHSVLFRLPAIAFATLAVTGETVALRLGEARYYRVETGKSADELNYLYGVSPAQARAMLAGVLLGWDTRLADPELYDASGGLRPDADDGFTAP